MNCFLTSLLAASTVAAISLPHPQGHYGTASSQILLTDYARKDPYAAKSGITMYRNVMLSSFYPIAIRKTCLNYTACYMPAKTAAFYDEEYAAYGLPNGTFGSLTMEFCHPQNDILGMSFPVVLFSPGLGNSRLIYSAMAQSLASMGFIVVTMDHPYDADITEYPDGTIALAANITTVAQIETALDVRVKDVSFVLNQLSMSKVTRPLFGGRFGVNAKNNLPFAMLGHSLGGATAAAAAMVDERLTAAVNLDGTLFGSILSQGSSRPLLLVAHEGKTLTSDMSWAQAWNATNRTTIAAIAISETVHASYTDFPIIVDALEDITQELRNQLAQLVGTMPAIRLQHILDIFVNHFIFYSQGKKEYPLSQINSTLSQDVQLLGELVNEKRSAESLEL